MWRRIFSSHIKPHAAPDFAAVSSRRFVGSSPVGLHLDVNRSAISAFSSVFSRHFSAETSVNKKVEDVMPIATGHEREELQAELEGRRLLDIDYPEGPFGTKESPAVVKSFYDKRIVGCPGGEGEEEHDVVWFWLEKGNSFECSVCSQYFELEVVGPGGPPDGHGEDDNHHH